MQLRDKNCFPTEGIDFNVTEIASKRIDDGRVAGSVRDQDVCNAPLEGAVGDHVATRNKTKCKVILPGLSIVKTSVSRTESELMSETVNDAITAAAARPEKEGWGSGCDDNFTTATASCNEDRRNDNDSCTE